MLSNPASYHDPHESLAEIGKPEQRQTADLPDQLPLLVLRRWPLLVASATVTALILVTTASSRQPVYEATARLMVIEPKPTTSAMLANVASFRALIENHTLAAQVIRDFKLDEPPLALTPAVFINSVLSVEEIHNTTLINVSVRLPDAKVAADVANALSQGASDMSRQLSQQEATGFMGQIKERLDEARTRLATTEKNLLDYRVSAQIELLKTDTTAWLAQRAELPKLLIDIEIERAHLKAAEQDLAKQTPILTVRKSIDDDPAMMEAARSTVGDQLLKYEMRNEVINGIYQNVEQQAVNARARLAALEQQRREANRLKLDAAQLPELSLLYRRELEVARLETEHNLANRLYEDVASRYEVARVQAASNSAQLQVVDRAFPPRVPLSRRRLTWAGLGFSLGLVLSLMALLLFEAWRLMRARLGHA